MTHRTLVACLSIAAAAGCSAGDTARTSSEPSLNISDGAHQQAFNDPNGNPDFFFLPTMVPNPVNDPDYDPDDFNAKLLPVVNVCVLDLPPSAPESAVELTTPCRPGGYTATLPAPVNGGLQKYQASWTVPVSPDAYYRLRVMVGLVSLGFADVHSVGSPSLLKTVNKNRFVGQQDGSSLPIPFRIEIGALCTPAGLRPCDSSTLGLETGGTVNISTDGGSTVSGVRVPPQNSQSGNHTFTVQPCDDLNPRAIDLPTFGSCIRVVPTPALAGALEVPGVVAICDLAGDISTAGLTEEQEELVTLHKLQGSTVKALPHVAGCAITTGSVTPSFKSVIRNFARGNLQGAVFALARMAGPAPLHARRLDVGGAGEFSECCSDHQFALSAKMEIHAGNAQAGPFGTLLPVEPAVKVTDLNGDPVANATVTFTALQGSVGAGSVTTAADGIAKTPWTLGAPIGTQGAVASGRGIAGENADGPRAAFDPFMAIQPHFNAGSDPVPDPLQPVTLQTGRRTFTAAAFVPFGASGYSYLVVDNNTASPPGWQSGAGTGFVAGTAPFASPGRPCFYSRNTAWASHTDILVRKTFELLSVGTVQVRVAMDQEVVEIWLNGVAMTGGPLEFSDCAAPNAATNSVFSGAGHVGTNLLAIRVKARSTSSFLDMKISAP